MEDFSGNLSGTGGLVTLAVGGFLIWGIGQGGDVVFYTWLVILSAVLWLVAAAALTLATVSRQPVLPHWQTWPLLVTATWPISPAPNVSP